MTYRRIPGCGYAAGPLPHSPALTHIIHMKSTLPLHSAYYSTRCTELSVHRLNHSPVVALKSAYVCINIGHGHGCGALRPSELKPTLHKLQV